MDFISESFPQNHTHICLFKLTAQNDEALNNTKNKLAQFVKQHQNSFSVVNAEPIVSLMHINIAVARALVNKRDNAMKTQSLGNEIVYHLSTNHSIQNSLENFGVKNCSKGFFTIMVDLSSEEQLDLKGQISSIEGVEFLPNLNQHIEFQNQQ